MEIIYAHAELQWHPALSGVERGVLPVLGRRGSYPSTLVVGVERGVLHVLGRRSPLQRTPMTSQLMQHCFDCQTLHNVLMPSFVPQNLTSKIWHFYWNE